MIKRIIGMALVLAFTFLCVPHNVSVSDYSLNALDDIMVYSESIVGDDSDSKNSIPTREYLSVIIQLDESFKCESQVFNSKEDLVEHRKK